MPDHLLHLIGLFCRWKMWQSLATAEGMDPDPLQQLYITHEINATRAEKQYRTALAEAQAATSAASSALWLMDHHDRIY